MRLAMIALLAGLSGGALADAPLVTLDLNGETRQETLARLLDPNVTEIIWKDPAVAEQPLRGHFEGNLDQVVAQLLAPANFAIIYEGEGAASHIARIIVMAQETSAAVAGPAQAAPMPPIVTPAQQRNQPLGHRRPPNAAPGRPMPNMLNRRRPPVPGANPANEQ